ncbi:hypothetical protein JHK84_034757 [Glycine max]|nr:hypothetical protein JHK84_034757 [Glycine max]
MFSGDGSSMDPMFSGMSLQSLLSMNPSLFEDGFPTLSSLTDDVPTLIIPQSTELNHTNANTKLPIPKTEPLNFFPQYQLPPLCSPEPKRQRLESPPVIPQSSLARQRRQKLSEKTRYLQKLMPWDKKMDQATLLEEAYKYVKFLQAQSRVLHSMPSHSHSHSQFGQNGAAFGDLEKLNRSQALQVLVNSPVAQTMLYSQGFCVFSLEQLSLLRKLSQTRQQQQHMPPDPASSSRTFFN